MAATTDEQWAARVAVLDDGPVNLLAGLFVTTTVTTTVIGGSVTLHRQVVCFRRCPKPYTLGAIMPRPLLPLAGLVLLGAATCSGERTRDDLEAYFAKGKIGASPDVGLYRFSQLGGVWDHLATIHSMDDDAGFCAILVEGLKATHPDDQFRCTAVN